MSKSRGSTIQPIPHQPPDLTLAIDTSCDDTSVAITLGKVVLANIIASQTNLHKPYGGVFPTLAKQAHQENLAPAVRLALETTKVTPKMLDAVAVTQGPGLAPALEVGITFAQKFAQEWQKPLLTINHLEAHLLSVLVAKNGRSLPTKQILQAKQEQKSVNSDLAKHYLLYPSLKMPVLGLIFSGGHSQFVQIDDIGRYTVLGQTIDDALGEALDKVGRMAGLGYPAAPVIEKLAKFGKSEKFEFPLPMTASGDFNLSYSGLKTAAHRIVKQLEKDELTKVKTLDLIASFQQAAFKHLCHKLKRLLEEKQNKEQIGFQEVWLGGGVARNAALKKMIRQTIKPFNLKLKIPYEKRLCSDNAAMIGVTANLRLAKNLAIPVTKPDRKPSWQLNELITEP